MQINFQSIHPVPPDKTPPLPATDKATANVATPTKLLLRAYLTPAVVAIEIPLPPGAAASN
jgi:hypothetical protein